MILTQLNIDYNPYDQMSSANCADITCTFKFTMEEMQKVKVQKDVLKIIMDQQLYEMYGITSKELTESLPEYFV